MPLVHLRYKPHRIPRVALLKIAAGLPGIIAPALHIEGRPEARLVPEEIEVEPHALAGEVINAKDVSIVVEANACPERESRLEDIEQQVREAVRQFCIDHRYDYNLTISVWVRLAPGAYGVM